MGQELHHNGEYVIVKNHRIHIFRAGNGNGPKLVFLSGSGTVAPVYDFKILYQKLLNDYSDEKIGREAFLEFKKQHEEEMKELEDKLAKLRSRQEARAANREPPSMEKYREILEAAELTQEIMNAFVEDVEVFGNGRLGIHLKAVAEFE